MKWLAKSKVKPDLKSSSQRVMKRKGASDNKAASDKLFTNVKTKVPPKVKHVTKETSVKYYVQAGAFSAMPNKAYLSKIKALGLRYTVRHADNYKVLIGTYKDEKGAREALKKVRKHINNGAFIVKL